MYIFAGDEASMLPTAYIQPDYLDVKVGGTLMLTCSAAGSPSPDVSWSRGQGFPLSDRVSKYKI